MKTKLLIMVLAVIALFAYAAQLKSEVKYADMDCPRCGSSEVLDFGIENNGSQKCHCADCSCEFFIESEVCSEED